MPFFSDRFTVKKAPARKEDAVARNFRSLITNDTRAEYGSEVSSVCLSLDGRRILFDEVTGKWVWNNRTPDTHDSSDGENSLKVMSENRLLRLKIEILTDLVRESLY